MFCKWCGARNDAGYAFCQSCGKSLNEGGSEAAGNPTSFDGGTGWRYNDAGQTQNNMYGTGPIPSGPIPPDSAGNGTADDIGATQYIPQSGAYAPNAPGHEPAAQFVPGAGPSAPGQSGGQRSCLAALSGRNRNIVILGVVALAVIVVAIIAFTVGPRVQRTLSTPELTQEMIESDFAFDSTATLSDSTWASNDGYSMTDFTVDSQGNIYDADSGTGDGERIPAQDVNVTVEYENGTFRATISSSCTYYYMNEQWQAKGFMETNRTIEPIGGIDDEALVASVPTFMQMVDENDPYEDNRGRTVKLANLYVTDTDFQVTENTTGPDGGSVTFSLYASAGVAAYQGTMVVDFDWNGGDWDVSGVSVDDAAYQKDYSPMIGTWNGTFEETKHNSVMDQAACYGGKDTPLTVTVTSVDNQAGTVTADLSFLVHNHGVPDNAVNSYDGDTAISLQNVLLTVDKVTSSYIEVYESNDPTGYSLEFSFSDDGTFRAKVLTDTYMGTQRSGVAWRTDYFTMNKE